MALSSEVVEPASSSSTGEPSSPRKNHRPIHQVLNVDLLSHISSFCNAAELVRLLDASRHVFQEPVRSMLPRAEHLNLSYLLRIAPNRNPPSQEQTEAISKLTTLLPTRESRGTKTSNLGYLECSGLRLFSGFSNRLEPQIFRNIVELNFSGCVQMTESSLVDIVQACTHSILHLNIQQCVKVGPMGLRAIVRALKGQTPGEGGGEPTIEEPPKLQSLLIGGCSNRIRYPEIRETLGALPNLKHFDMSGMTHFREKAIFGHDLVSLLPPGLVSLQLAGCSEVELGGPLVVRVSDGHDLNVHNQINTEHEDLMRLLEESERPPPLKLLNLNTTGPSRLGVRPGALAFFSLGGFLREVCINGASRVGDWEIVQLARNCGRTLKVFSCRACGIGQEAMRALARYCNKLAELDVSACGNVDDEALLTFCWNQSELMSIQPDADGSSTVRLPKRRVIRRPPTLKTLKISNTSVKDSVSILELAHIKSLQVLHALGLSEIQTACFYQLVQSLPNLLEIDARGSIRDVLSLRTWLQKNEDGRLPKSLRFVDGKLLDQKNQCNKASCCSAALHGQRLQPKATIPLQAMMHCRTCDLVPQFNRGVCTNCASRCHEGHDIYLGSWTLFYCDCSFGIPDNNCQAMGV